MDMDALLQRLQQLEARDAIRTLKHRYLACCDAKDVVGFRACFADDTVDIDYGPVGQFDNADDLADLFRQMACHSHMLEWHLASNDEIELLSPEQARGRWSMHYQLINTEEAVLTQLGGVYADEYCLSADGWKIRRSHFTQRSCLVLKLDESAVKTLVGGPPQQSPTQQA